ncbi:MAG: hypothetical protein IKA79_06250, partial [Lentisphaeria bacterium]|nr:hypothetical protein [Lentisphaeria bacterium]
MIFWGIIAGGIIGGTMASKNKLLDNWCFLICSLFAAYFAFVLSPVGLDILKDFKEVPDGVRNGGLPMILFIVFEVALNKVFTGICGDNEYFDFLPQQLEKLLGFVTGLGSGMLLIGMIIFCAMAGLPGYLGGEKLETQKQRTGEAKNIAGNILSIGNTLTFSHSRSEKQSRLLERLLPTPVEKKADKISEGNVIPDKKKVKKKRKKKSSVKKSANPDKTLKTAAENSRKIENKGTSGGAENASENSGRSVPAGDE